MVEGSAVLFMLWNEAIRLGSRQEQNDGRISSRQQPVAPTHDRRHADAQTLTTDTERLYPRRAAVHWLPWPVARHGHGRRSAALPIAPGRSRGLAGVAQCGDHRVEVLLRGHARPG